MSYTIKVFTEEDFAEAKDDAEIDTEIWADHYGAITRSGAMFMLPSDPADESILQHFKDAGAIYLGFGEGAASLEGPEGSHTILFDYLDDFDDKLVNFKEGHSDIGGQLTAPQLSMARVVTARNCELASEKPGPKPKGCGGNLTVFAD